MINCMLGGKITIIPLIWQLVKMIPICKMSYPEPDADIRNKRCSTSDSIQINKILKKLIKDVVKKVTVVKKLKKLRIKYLI